MALKENFFKDSMFDDNCWSCPHNIQHECTNHKCMVVKTIKAILDDFIYNYFETEDDKERSLQATKDLFDYLVYNCLNYTTFEEWEEQFDKYPIMKGECGEA